MGSSNPDSFIWQPETHGGYGWRMQPVSRVGGCSSQQPGFVNVIRRSWKDQGLVISCHWLVPCLLDVLFFTYYYCYYYSYNMVQSSWNITVWQCRLTSGVSELRRSNWPRVSRQTPTYTRWERCFSYQRTTRRSWPAASVNTSSSSSNCASTKTRKTWVVQCRVLLVVGEIVSANDSETRTVFTVQRLDTGSLYLSLKPKSKTKLTA